MAFLDGDAADVGLLSPVWAGSAAAALTSDRSYIQAMLDVELAWVQVLAEAGLVPAESAEAVAAICQAGKYDAASVAERARDGGNPVIPLLADMRRLAGPGPGSAIHRAATSQDVLDTAVMLVAHRVLEAVLADTRRSTAALAQLARDHAGTPAVARTLTQHSLPAPFGLKAAHWFGGTAEAGSRLSAVAAQLPLQWGGAAGTAAALEALADPGSDPDALTRQLADRLGLRAPAAPWHSNRLPITVLAAALQDLLAAAGKIANDVLLLSRPEIAEVSEPRAAGRGVSSAMPQKQNPVLSVLIRSAALSAPGYGFQLQLAAGTAVDERPDGAWHVEWQALRQLLRLAGGAAAALAELVQGLTVNRPNMLRNLNLSGPLLVSEKVMAQVAPLLDGGSPGTGTARITELVTEALSGGRDFEALLREAVPSDVLSDQELHNLLDPAQYTGRSGAMIERLLGAYPDWSGQ